MKNKVALRKWLLTAVALLAGYWMITRVVVFSSVDRHLTPAWFESEASNLGPLLRMEEGDGSAILITLRPDSEPLDPDAETGENKLRQEPMFPVYRYTPETKPALVPASEWMRAEGQPTPCTGGLISASTGLRWTPSTETIQFKQRVLRTAGSRTMACTVTPNRTKAAIMSAGGPRMFTLVSFFGDPGAFGPHYQQVLDLETGEFVGDTVRLPFVTAIERALIRLCWSPDERSVVYAQYQGKWISIVPVER